MQSRNDTSSGQASFSNKPSTLRTRNSSIDRTNQPIPPRTSSESDTEIEPLTQTNLSRTYLPAAKSNGNVKQSILKTTVKLPGNASGISGPSGMAVSSRKQSIVSTTSSQQKFNISQSIESSSLQQSSSFSMQNIPQNPHSHNSEQTATISTLQGVTSLEKIQNQSNDDESTAKEAPNDTATTSNNLEEKLFTKSIIENERLQMALEKMSKETMQSAELNLTQRYKSVIGGIERLSSTEYFVRRSSSSLSRYSLSRVSRDSKPRLSFRKKHGHIEVKELDDAVIPQIVLNTILIHPKSLDQLLALEIIDTCLDNMYLLLEDKAAEQNQKTTMDWLGGCATVDIDEIGLSERFFAGMKVYMDEVHLIDVNGKEYTKGAILDKAIKLASKMGHLGISESDIVVICSRTHVEQNIAVLASVLLGTIIAPMPIEMTLDDYDRFFSALQPRMVFCDPRSQGPIMYCISRYNFVCNVVLFSPDDPNKYDGFEKFIANHNFEGFFVAQIQNPKAKPAFIIPTVGTTGASKLCILTHYNMTCRSLLWKYKILRGCSRLMSWFPLNWFMQLEIFGSCYELPITLIMNNKLSERAICRSITEYQVDMVVLGTPFAVHLSKNAARMVFIPKFYYLIYNLSALQIVD